MPQRSLIDVLAPAAFVGGLLAVAFGGGFLAGAKQVFPHRQLAAAEEALRGAYNAYFRPPPFDRPAPAGVRRDGPTLDPDRVAPGVTFVVGYRREGFGAWVVDRDGTVLHRWRGRFSEIFGQAPQLLWQARDETIAWHGAHLYPDGSILINFQDNSFPYGSGLVKLDRDSKVLWKLERNTHHDVSVGEDGTIWVPAHRYRPDGVPGFGNLEPWYYEDLILKVSPDGQVLDEISVLAALGEHPGLTTVTYDEDVGLEISSRDPTHLNNVEPLPRALAAAFPQFSPGDLLVSLRNLNTIAVVDPRTKALKWSLTGSFVQQHDPDFLPNGHILLFDNLGGLNGDPSCGRSRILEIDPATQAVVWRYTGCDGHPFDSERRGTQQLLGNGNVLIAESLRGRAFEVTREPEPKIVWEHHNLLGGLDEPDAVGVITHAERFRPADLPFLQDPVS
jgi:Arylsulfotransferase (ASST)